jgi:hypothetical protein
MVTWKLSHPGEGQCSCAWVWMGSCDSTLPGASVGHGKLLCYPEVQRIVLGEMLSRGPAKTWREVAKVLDLGGAYTCMQPTKSADGTPNPSSLLGDTPTIGCGLGLGTPLTMANGNGSQWISN